MEISGRLSLAKRCTEVCMGLLPEAVNGFAHFDSVFSEKLSESSVVSGEIPARQVEIRRHDHLGHFFEAGRVQVINGCGRNAHDVSQFCCPWIVIEQHASPP